MSDDDDMGVIREAMALRVKFRIVDLHGKPLRQRYHLTVMSPHPQNRGGNFPAGPVTKTLGMKIGKGGFSSEEANSMGVCVEEIPPDERAQDPVYNY